MKSDSDVREWIKVWRVPDLGGLELHVGNSVVRSYPRHWHEEFHLCVIEGGGGDLYYRGAEHATPAGCLFIVHPGEVHANQTLNQKGCSYRNLYIEPDLLQRMASEIDGTAGLPFFPVPVLFDPLAIRKYLQLHNTLEDSSSRLEQDSLLLDLLVYLIGRHSSGQPSLPPPGKERESVRRVRDFLAENYVENVSLTQLADIARLSPFYLSRVFCLEFGLPPHAFQNQVRILKAKLLLKQGFTISHAAYATGFADQSHLTRHFKRLIGVPPGEYARKSRALGLNSDDGR